LAQSGIEHATFQLSASTNCAAAFPHSVEREVFIPKISKMFIQLFTQMLCEHNSSSHIVAKFVEWRFEYGC
jgi:hypothetical protein